MIKGMRPFPALALLALCAWASPGTAAVTAVSAVHGAGNIPVNRSQVVTVRWQVQVSGNPTGGSQTVTVRSPRGRFLSGVSLVQLGTVDAPLARRVEAPATVTIGERLRIPAGVLQKAVREGGAVLRYQREFDDGTSSAVAVTGELMLNLSGASGGGFAIDRISLRFDDDAPQRLVAQDAALQARAEVSFTGTGLLRAVWEIADPASTMGRPVFRTLRSVRQQLSASDRVRLTSPRLPTAQAGLYQIRLRLLEPALDAAPVIYYFVRGRAVGQPAPARLNLLGPRDGSLLAADTRFRWQAVEGASAYRLEIHERPRPSDPGDDGAPVPGSATQGGAPPVEDPPLTGMLVPAGQTASGLSAAARSHLASGGGYLWRVQAIGADGRIVGVSPLRGLRLP